MNVYHTSYAPSFGMFDVESYFTNPQNWPGTPRRHDRRRVLVRSIRSVVGHYRRHEPDAAFRERAYGLLNPSSQSSCFWWADCVADDTRFLTMFPMNPFRKIPDAYVSPYGGAYVYSASSFHPGGANFAFADGSVRFLKDTMNSWKLNADGTVAGLSQDSNGFYHLAGDPTGC